MKKLVLGLMVSAGFFGGTALAANADTSTGSVGFTAGTLSMSTDNTADLTFGNQAITNTDTNATASSTPIVTVSDMRGSSAGWSLTVNQMAQFKTADDDSLSNAALTVAGTADATDVTGKSATLTPGDGTVAGADGVVANAAKDTGNGLTKVTFTGSQLSVPAATNKLAKNYTTTLTWTLSDSPSNS